MATELIRVKQMLDTPTRVLVHHAFARAELQLYTDDCKPAIIELDIESTITLIDQFDDGKKISEILRMGKMFYNPPDGPIDPTHGWVGPFVCGVVATLIGMSLVAVL